MEKFKKYVELKEKRLSEAVSVVSPELILKHLSAKMFKSGKKGYEEVLRKPSLLLEEVSHSRIVSALRKQGFPFYTGEMRKLRSDLFAENYGLICKAVLRVAGSLSEDLVSSASVYFLEGLDNLRLPFSSKPQTYLFSYVTGRLKEEMARNKGGMTILSYLRKVCGYGKAGELLASGKVSVNGKVIYDKNFRVRVEDEIIIEGEERFLPSSRVLCSEETRPEERLERESLWREVEMKVGKLNASLLREYFSGSSIKEVAEKMNMAVTSVKSRIDYSLNKLRRTVGSPG